MKELKDKSQEEVKRNNRLLGERNQQIHSLEKDLAIKEETIQKMRVELEESQLTADQVQNTSSMSTVMLNTLFKGVSLVFINQGKELCCAYE